VAERRLHVLNNSRATAARSCLRKHYYGYELGYVRRERAEPLVTGSRHHKWLENWWKALADGKRGDDVLEIALATLEPVVDPYEQIRGEVLVQGYHHRWIDEPIEVLGVEVPFEAPLVDPITGETNPDFILGGTIDAVCRVASRVLCVEHKTTSQDFSAGAYYWQKLTLNPQVSQYIAAGPALGFDITGCLYDVIGKAPDIEPKLATPEADRKYTKAGELYARQRDTDEEPEAFRARLVTAMLADPGKFYGRAEIVRLGDELEESILDVWQIGELISEARARSRWPRNPDQCFAFNRECDFYGVCARGESLENEQFEREERQQP